MSLLNIYVSFYYIIFLSREFGSADIKEIKLMVKGKRRYETVGTLHFASVR